MNREVTNGKKILTIYYLPENGRYSRYIQNFNSRIKIKITEQKWTKHLNRDFIMENIINGQ